ncbi:hypothetical protein HDU81_004187 [Chytriomyces hyalinus]|nr:hypothetical protein HDU81_004187 [Chytriomyces hyalinus]
MEELFAYGVQQPELHKHRELGKIQAASRSAMIETEKQISEKMDKLGFEIQKRYKPEPVDRPFLAKDVREVYMQMDVDLLGRTHGSVESPKGLEVLWLVRKRLASRLSVPQGLVVGVFQWDKQWRKVSCNAAHNAVRFGGIKVVPGKGLYSDDHLSGDDDNSDSSICSGGDTEVSCTSMARMF